MIIVFNGYRTKEYHHLVCLRCLQEHFQECLHTQIQYRDIPARIRISKEPPYTAQELETLFAESVIHILLYHCPVCHTTIMDRPKELRPLTQIMEALTGVLGAPARTTQAVNMDGDIWAGIFPKSHF